MTSINSKITFACFVVMAFFSTSVIQAEDKLNPGKVTFDLPTAHTLSIVVPTSSCDDNRNGTIAVFYREGGKGKWKDSFGLFRTRNGGGSSQPFAGMLFSLKEDTEYEIKLVAKDPDGVGDNAEQIVKARTKKIPQRVKATAGNTVEVSSIQELTAAISAAKPGTVILLKKGLYRGNVSVKGKSGTADNPIVIRGTDKSDCIIHGRFTIASSKHIHVENLTVQRGGTGFYLSKCDSLAIRDNLILGIDNGITAKGGHRSLYIANNVLIGNNVIGDRSNRTWNDEGIVLSGEGHELANNTLAGFGDTIGMTHRSSLKNRAIDMHHNLVLWTGDDGVEMDFTGRNAAAHHNLFTNSANGISCQMVWNGPAYVFKNVMYNTYRGPYKVKPERAGNFGLFIFNNTTIKAGMAMLNYSTEVDGFLFLNNLVIGTKSGQLLSMGRHGNGIRNLTMDYNAWSYDGSFSIAGYGRAKNFEQWKTNHKQGNHDVLLAGQKIFDKLNLDFDKNKWDTWRYPFKNFSLDKDSKAIDAGKVIPGINDNFKGKAPDIGAWEKGENPPIYGAYPGDKTPPSVPGNVKTNSVSGTQIDLSWDASKDPESGIIYYMIYRDGKTVGVAICKTSYSDKTVTDGTKPSYQVVAMNGASLESKNSPLKTGQLKLFYWPKKKQ